MACRQVKAKRELVRLVCSADGIVEVDNSGKKTGRGAYLCEVWGCWEAGLKGRQLERSLRTTINAENKQQLVQYGKSLNQGIANGQGSKDS